MLGEGLGNSKGAEMIILRSKVNSFKGMLMKMLLDEFTPQTGTNTKSTNQKAETELATKSSIFYNFFLNFSQKHS